MDKKTLRKQKMNERDSLSEEKLQALSDIITKEVLDLEEYKESSIVLCYVSCRSEVRTEKLIERALMDGKIVGVPKVEGDDMCFYRIDSLKDLETGYFGILEPKKSVVKDNIPISPEKCLVIVPGLAFDEKMNRIGYGKGFYDRFFAKYRNLSFTRCGIAYDIQMTERIETDEYDCPLDIIVTDKSVLSKR